MKSYPDTVQVNNSLSLQQAGGVISMVFHKLQQEVPPPDNEFNRSISLKSCGHFCASGGTLCCRCSRGVHAYCKICNKG